MTDERVANYLNWIGWSGQDLGRYALSGYVARRFGETFPTGTLVVNVVGCLLASCVFFILQERFLPNEVVRTTLLIGLLGG